MIDFSTGLAMNTSEPNPTIYKLDKSKKGHYVLDIVRYLTNGVKVLEGQAHVVVRSSSPTACALEQQGLELHTMWFDLAACDHDLDEQDRSVAETRMWQLYNASRTSSTSTAVAAQASMFGPAAHRLISTPSSSRSPDVGVHSTPPGSGGECYPPTSRQGTPEGQGQAVGHESSTEDRSSRPQGFEDTMALSGATQPGPSQGERSRTVASLSGVRCSPTVCPSPRVDRPVHSMQESRDGGSLPTRTSQAAGRPDPNSDPGSCHAGQDRCGGDLECDDQRPPVQDRSAELFSNNQQSNQRDDGDWICNRNSREPRVSWQLVNGERRGSGGDPRGSLCGPGSSTMTSSPTAFASTSSKDERVMIRQLRTLWPAPGLRPPRQGLTRRLLYLSTWARRS